MRRKRELRLMRRVEPEKIKTWILWWMEKTLTYTPNLLLSGEDGGQSSGESRTSKMEEEMGTDDRLQNSI